MLVNIQTEKNIQIALDIQRVIERALPYVSNMAPNYIPLPVPNMSHIPPLAYLSHPYLYGQYPTLTCPHYAPYPTLTCPHIPRLPVPPYLPTYPTCPHYA